MRFSDFLDNQVESHPPAPVPEQPVDHTLPERPVAHTITNTPLQRGDGPAPSPQQSASVASPAAQPSAAAANRTYEHVLGPPPSAEPSPFAELLHQPTPMPAREMIEVPTQPTRVEHAELEAIIEAIVVAPLDEDVKTSASPGLAAESQEPASIAPSIDDDLLPSHRKHHGRTERQAPRAWSFGRSKR